MVTIFNEKIVLAPLGDMAIGGIASAAGNLLGAGIQALTQPSLRQQRESKQKYDAWYQQNITEKNMALTNQYQIDAENRANEYNSPSAVRSRLEAAGVSPESALGSGNSGAGIQGSISGAPSASGGGSFSPTPMSIRVNPFEGVAGMIGAIKQTRLTESEIEKNKADAMAKLMSAGVSKEQARQLAYQTDNVLPVLLEGYKLKNATDEQKKIQEEINTFVAQATAEDSIAEKSLLLTEIRARIDKLKEDKKFVKANAKYVAALEETENDLRESKKENIVVDTENKKEEKNLILANARNARSNAELNEEQLDFVEWLHQFDKDHAKFDKILSNAKDFADIIETLIDAYATWKGSSRADSQAKEKSFVDKANLLLFAFRFLALK